MHKYPSQVYRTQKELLYLVKFDTADVLEDKNEQKLRFHELYRGMQLGNLYKNKVFITFKDSLNNLLMINTTIWGLTQKSIILKKGVTIPINSILKVE
ncbi:MULTISPECIES: hypothetical protein [Nonlabens]|uniref:Uncharacterized protein n=1 Tax=Nonlabens xylanidelens TaxID=191564 RepID=A0A2S6IQ91_9FLAO|nr:hypothetical protein [Nonlabens xylanidelens]PPK96276.1 hypothetical protein LY01_00092 [Nonlabens xylanidelens]PQJ18009.1 hypothetical protein BST94_08320 [Nonlabens xylanidelens]